MKKTSVLNGIEGDDIPYHLQLLGFDVNNIVDEYFVSLNDHYGLHTDNWLEQTITTAQQYKKVIFYDLINTGDEYHEGFCNFVNNFPHEHKIYLTNNFSKKFFLENVRVIPWDFMRNRTKLYYTDINKQLVEEKNLILHHYTRQEKYILNDLNFDKARDKIFLNLCGRAYGYRRDLHQFLNTFQHIGYQSLRTEGIHLESDPQLGAYTPIPNYFYDNSYVSIYSESNCLSNELIHITEKTFEPLIKGHFILPFANIGTIARLRDLGFRFPEFIDYSYDSIDEVRWRFAVYKKTVSDILKLPIRELYQENFDIILHNRKHFFELDYDRAILEIFT